MQYLVVMLLLHDNKGRFIHQVHHGTALAQVHTHTHHIHEHTQA